jgi:multidrug efflux pump subunit AcrB
MVRASGAGVELVIIRTMANMKRNITHEPCDLACPYQKVLERCVDHPGYTMISVASVKTLVLDLPPSCIEFWPLNPQYAVVGTYNLEKSASTDESAEQIEQLEELETKKGQQRSGSLILLRVDGNDV